MPSVGWRFPRNRSAADGRRAGRRQLAVERGLSRRERCDRCGNRRILVRPVKPGAGQKPDRAPIQAGVHPVAVEFDFMQPLWPFGCLVDEPGELRFDPAGERRCLGAPPVVERSRHVLGTTRMLPRIDPAQIYSFTCRMTFVHRSTMGSTVSAFSGGNIGTTRATPISARPLPDQDLRRGRTG